MSHQILRPSRRAVLGGLGAASLGIAVPGTLAALDAPAPGQVIRLQAKIGQLALLPGQPARPVWELAAPVLRVRRGAGLDLMLSNELAIPVALSLRGPAGVPNLEPLLAQPALAPGATVNLTLSWRQAGTAFCDIRLLCDGAAAPARVLPFIIDESEAANVDRDEVFLIEDWRLTPDGTPLPPGIDPKDAAIAFTINGQTMPDIRVRRHERVRLRFINGCQRAVIAIKVADLDVGVMAIDGQPAEPFSARNGAVILPPGGRTDAFIDVPAAAAASSAILLHDGTAARPVARLVASDEPPTRPAPRPPAAALPSNGLPDRLDLKGAQRVELALDGPDWVPPAGFAASSAPAFQAKTGRTMVLALTSRAPIATVFHLHGHHFRLLDRLDDGWKPYWLDTLALEPGQTQRIAFAAETAGRFLIESMATAWTAPRLLRWYEVR
jgi:FtsP/CotA-like multicopper oxidase with cupredoxin domain